MRTDTVDGFRLDRGFQVLLTAYPEARRVLDYAGLDLRSFEPGALVRFGGRFHRFVDPWRRPARAFETMGSPVASLLDKVRVAQLRRRVTRGSVAAVFERPESTTMEALRAMGFSNRVIERFFRPFLGGVFLDRDLDTSSRLFEFVFRMFASGDAAIPARGIGAIPEQLAGGLPAGSVRIGARVVRVARDSVTLASGDSLRADSVVVACEAPAAQRLLGDEVDARGRGVTCLYFDAPRPPIDEPILVLGAEDDGPIHNLCVPSQVAPELAPPGRSLVSATVLGSDGDEDAVRRQLTEWFGTVVDRWRHLRTVRIEHALPRQVPPALSPVAKPTVRSDGVIVCGDWLDTASIQGAMVSGRRAAEAVLARLGATGV